MRGISKKTIVFLALIVVFGMLVSACGGSQDAKEQSKTGEQAAEKVNFPEKEITLMVPWSAGGSTDFVGRTLANIASKYLPEPVIVVNREGANGIIGFSELANTKPDGYTIAVGATGVFTTSPLTQEGVAYKMEDFEFLVGFTEAPIVISVPGDSPYNTLEELFAASKEDGLVIRYANSGMGGIPQTCMAHLFNLAGVKSQPIPFSGNGPALTAALGGTANCDAVATHPSEIVEHVKTGKIRPLAISSLERMPLLPDLPTMKELGYDVNISVRNFAVAPKGLPEDVKKVLTDSLTKTVNDPDFKKAVEDACYIYDPMTGQEVEDYLNDLYPIVKGIIESNPKTTK